ncbi:MAG: heme exporter protein CcmD [Paracoccaceae bacterium]
MWPDLGRYAVAVLASYGVTLGVLGALTWASVRRHAALRRELAREEGADRDA